MPTLPLSVIWQDSAVHLLDQTRLPHEESVIVCRDIETVFEAIQTLRVRGAPAIGIAAAYGLILGLSGSVSLDALKKRGSYLVSARPTAVNLAWSVNRVMQVARKQTEDRVSIEVLEREAILIHQEDIAACQAIGRLGLPLVAEHPNLLTHCNAGALAVSELGTALAPVYLANERGHRIHVFVDETRPLLQGARLTAYELTRQGVPNTLISDNMAAHVMSLGRVDAVIVGADRVAINGDVANKIGTLNLAILCRHFEIPFYVACPLSTVDPSTVQGKDIEIEQRSAQEVTHIMKQQISASGLQVYNPAFDVTPASLVSAIVTDKDIVYQPTEAKMKQLLSL